MQPKHKPVIVREIGDGLVLRRTTSADSARLADFNKHIHRNDETQEPDETVAVWTRDLLRGNHPTFHPDDFVLVEEQATHKIISATCLIDQTWTYDGIPFGVGRPELVGTLPEYRRRGLIRQLFQVIHAWSAERGQLAQAITGIPWYYRQFGYEMTLPLGGGRLANLPQDVPPLKKGQSEAYRVRPAVEGDVPFITRVNEAAAARSLVCERRDEAIWRYELLTRSHDSPDALQLGIVETQAGQPLGFVAHYRRVRMGTLVVDSFELLPNTPWAAVSPSVLRHFKAVGEKYARRQRAEFFSLAFRFGLEHPLYQVMPQATSKERAPYAWYMRVPDMPAFLRLVAPALERNLAHSGFVGYTGELKLNFFKSGVRLVLQDGCLKTIEAWAPESANDGDAAFPEQTFLHILFGHRSVAEVRWMYADAWMSGEPVQALINALFPRRHSRVRGIE